jgi:hypothetical protein
MIHTTQAVTLTYPAGQCGQALEAPALEESGDDCEAIPTGQFSSYYGQARTRDGVYPPRAIIRVLSPRGEVVGCGRVKEGGLFPYLRVYGADGDLPGMKYGETPIFLIDGQPAFPDQSIVWTPDFSVHEVQIDAASSSLYLPLLTP